MQRSLTWLSLAVLPAVACLAAACSSPKPTGNREAGPGGSEQGIDAPRADGAPIEMKGVEAAIDLANVEVKPHVLDRVTLNPQSPVLFACSPSTTTQAFKVIGHYMDGVTADVTSEVTSWKATMPSIGTFGSGATANVFTTTATAGFEEVDATVMDPTNPSPLTAATIVTSVPERCVGGVPVDFFFVSPYLGPSMPVSAPLAFSTTITQADLVYLVDSTGSMGGKIMAIQASLSKLAGDIAAKVPSLAMGVADFFSWPCGGDGSPPDQPFVLLNRVITVQAGGLANIQSAIAGMMATGGGDSAETDFDALYFASTGEGSLGGTAGTPAYCATTNVPKFDPSTAPGDYPGEQDGTIGGMGFRAGSYPIFILVSDAEMHDVDDPNDCAFSPPGPAKYGVAHGHNSTLAALQAEGARVIGIASSQGGCTAPSTFVGPCPSENEPYPQMYWLAEKTGAVVPPSAFGTSCTAGMCCTDASGGGTTFAPVKPDTSGNCPLAFKLDALGGATALDTAVESGILDLIQFGALQVTTKVLGLTMDESGNPLPTGHTTADFLAPVNPSVKGVTPDHSMPAVGTPGGCTALSTSIEGFIGCPPGVTVYFNVQPYNDFIPAQKGPQFFKATIEVFGNNVTKLDSRDVYILVPPSIIFG